MQKYGQHLQTLIRDHGYLTNAMTYKLHRGMGSGNQSDDEMAFMSFYNLVEVRPDPADSPGDPRLRRQRLGGRAAGENSVFQLRLCRVRRGREISYRAGDL